MTQSSYATGILAFALFACATGPYTRPALATPSPATSPPVTPAPSGLASSPPASAGTHLFAIPAAAHGDRVFSAASQELARNRRTLRFPDQPAPYYMSYTLRETERRTVGGKRGAVVVRDHRNTRTAKVDVRVGGYAFDSSEEDEFAHMPPEGLYEPTASLPMGDVGADEAAIRHALWLLTDAQYKKALAAHLRLQGERVYTPPETDARPSFSPAPATIQIDPLPQPAFNGDRWSAFVKAAGASLGRNSDVFDSEVQVDMRVQTRWFLNTEGVRVRTATTIYGIHIAAWARADDGMLVDRTLSLYAPEEAGLPTDPQLMVRVDRLLTELSALRAAPAMDPYVGPAILEPTATGVFFHEVLGHRLEAQRQSGDGDGQTFASQLSRSIMPDFISVADDPTLTHKGTTPLNGHYVIDDEGVPAQRAELVARGVLKGFLMGRTPVRGFERSNGHGRAQAGHHPVARMGNLIVTAHKTVSRATLRAMLMAEVRRQKKPYGLIIGDMTGGSTNTSSYGFQAFKGHARMVIRVDAKTGEETLVRGVEMVGTPLASLSKIVAATDEVGVFNGYCGAESGMVPVSAVAPATLFRDVELQRTLGARGRSPILPPPPE